MKQQKQSYEAYLKFYKQRCKSLSDQRLQWLTFVNNKKRQLEQIISDSQQNQKFKKQLFDLTNQLLRTSDIDFTSNLNVVNARRDILMQQILLKVNKDRLVRMADKYCNKQERAQIRKMKDNDILSGSLQYQQKRKSTANQLSNCQKQILENRIEQLKSILKKTVDLTSSTNDQTTRNIKIYSKRIKQLQDTHDALIRKILKNKLKDSDEMMRLAVQNDKLRTLNIRLKQRASIQVNSRKTQIDQTVKITKQKSQNFLRKANSEKAQRAQRLQIMTLQYQKIQQIFLAKLKEGNEKLVCQRNLHQRVLGSKKETIKRLLTQLGKKEKGDLQSRAEESQKESRQEQEHSMSDEIKSLQQIKKQILKVDRQLSQQAK